MMGAISVFRFMKMVFQAKGTPLLAVLALSLCYGGPARGEAVFSFEPVENGVYAIYGGGMANLAALDFTVAYDPATLRNPRLTKGPFVPGDASFIANTAISGELRLLVIRNREIAGDGVIATVTFERVEGKAPRILNFKSSPVSVAAAPVEARDRTVAPPAEPPPADPAPAATVPQATSRTGQSAATTPVVAASGQPTTGAETTGSGGQVYLGTVTFPGDEPPAKGGGSAEPARENIAAIPPTRHERLSPPERGEARGREPQRSPEGEKKRVLERYPNLPERFRDFTGTKTLAELTALFDGREGKVTQEPPIVLADGTGTATIRVTLTESGEETPVFLLEKARLVALQPDEQGWVLTVLPEQGTSQARLTLRTEAVLIDFPLVVVPPLPVTAKELSLDEAGLKRFLAERGTEKSPRFDLNGDGMRDYRDEFLFVAHLLLAKQGLK